MVTKLFVPERRIVVPKPPSYLKLDMAFAIGAGAKLMDKSRYRSHGDITGAAWATGLHGKALDFIAATPSYVEIPASHTQLNFTSEKLSIIARVYLDDLSEDKTIFMRGDFNDTGYWFYVKANGSLILRTFQSGTGQLSSSVAGSVTTGAWYTLGVSRDGESAIPYIKGVDAHSAVGTHIDPVTSSLPAQIGIFYNKINYPIDGKIEFFRVFGGMALSASEHLAYHNALA